jgi:mannitol operon repressor
MHTVSGKAKNTTMIDNTENPKIALFSKFLTEFQNESDRGAAILAASMLDQKLKAVLKDYLIEEKSTDFLFNGPNAPLGTFSAKQHLAFSLGLISEYEYHDCEIVRKIRNDFAHKFELAFSFSNSKIAALCLKLMASTPGDKQKFISNPRLLFINSVVMLYVHWFYREEYVRQNRLTRKNWGQL